MPSRKLNAATKPRVERPHHRLDSEHDIRQGTRALRRKCAFLRRVHDVVGDPPLRRHEAGFVGLARVVVGQQLSMASAEAIWRRTFAAVSPFGAAGLRLASDDALRAAGLSAGKIRTLRALASAVADGLDLDLLAEQPEEEIHERLTAIHGVGPWTADVYLMFCLGRADAWAPGDLALQIATQSALGLDSQPSARELLDIGERWRPWRGVAARLLWAHYRTIKRTSAQPV